MKIEIHDKMAIVTAKVKKNQNEVTQTDVKFTFDLSTFDESEILENAVKNLTIKAQSLWRKGKVGNIANLTKDDFKTRKPAKTYKDVARDFIKAELAKGRPIEEIMEELEISTDS